MLEVKALHAGYGPLRILRGVDMRIEAGEIVAVLGAFPRLGERLPQLAGTLSGGEQQMLATGRGLMAEPKLLILDEPSLGLSPLMVDEMFGMISTISREGVTVLLVEQNVVQSLDIAHRAYVLENGEFSLSGPARELAADPRLKQAYLGL
jgi:branched-chain amino acid transport system ATP-binding protein